MSADLFVLLALALADALVSQVRVPPAAIRERLRVLAACAPPQAAQVFQRIVTALEGAEGDPHWLAKFARSLKE